MANAAGMLPVRAERLGSWWIAHHELDVVGLDATGRVNLTGEAKWRERAKFDWHDLEKYLGHVRALGDLCGPGSRHMLITSHGFEDDVKEWAQQNNAMLVTAADMLAPWQPRH